MYLGRRAETEQQARLSSGVMQLPFGIQREINTLKAENEKLREWLVAKREKLRNMMKVQ